MAARSGEVTWPGWRPFVVRGGRPVIGAAFLALGIVFGVLAALTGAFDLLDGWLVAAYVLIGALLVVNASPWVQRLPNLGAEAMEAGAGERPAEKVLEGMRKSAPRFWLLLP